MKKKAVVLFSGGLDSILVYKIVENWGFEPIAVNFTSPFIKPIDKRLYEEKYNIRFKDVDFSKTQLNVVKFPKYGYGKAMNPCIDCHAAMLREAKTIMEKEGALFIATGEVVGQRPMSQRKDAMKSVEKLSEAKGYIVRPLSGKLLDETIPEKEGNIKREWLYGISGRGRKEQYKLCEEYGIKEIPSSGGGCLLTEKSFGNKVKIALKYEDERIINYLTSGRVFDLEDGVLVVARNKDESETLLKSGEEGIIEAIGIPGPAGIIFKSSKIKIACKILCRYIKKDKETIKFRYGNRIVEVMDEKLI